MITRRGGAYELEIWVQQSALEKAQAKADDGAEVVGDHVEVSETEFASIDLMDEEKWEAAVRGAKRRVTFADKRGKAADRECQSSEAGTPDRGEKVSRRAQGNVAWREPGAVPREACIGGNKMTWRRTPVANSFEALAEVHQDNVHQLHPHKPACFHRRGPSL